MTDPNLQGDAREAALVKFRRDMRQDGRFHLEPSTTLTFYAGWDAARAASDAETPQDDACAGWEAEHLVIVGHADRASEGQTFTVLHPAECGATETTCGVAFEISGTGEQWMLTREHAPVDAGFYLVSVHPIHTPSTPNGPEEWDCDIQVDRLVRASGAETSARALLSRLYDALCRCRVDEGTLLDEVDEFLRPPGGWPENREAAEDASGALLTEEKQG